jgi:hypothetical protein
MVTCQSPSSSAITLGRKQVERQEGELDEAAFEHRIEKLLAG